MSGLAEQEFCSMFLFNIFWYLVEQNNAILDELETFADAITNDTKPVVTLEQATEALKVAYQIIDCFKK